MLLTFITPLIEKDIPPFLVNLDLLLMKICPLQRIYPELKIGLNIVLQAAGSGALRSLREKVWSLCPDAIVVELSEANVSAARNRALSNLPAGCLTTGFVLFLDARIEYSEAFLRNLVSYCFAGVETILWGWPRFDDNSCDDSAHDSASSKSSVRDLSDIPGNPYIWNMAFRYDMLAGISFDENRGPGKQTKIKSGEDALFLNEVLNRRGEYRVRVVGGDVRHPSRYGELGKYAAYASGQVDLMCLLMKDRRLKVKVRVMSFFRYCLFIVASFRFLLKGRQGMNVFSSRMKALFAMVTSAADGRSC
jgi:hypothetical protein